MGKINVKANAKRKRAISHYSLAVVAINANVQLNRENWGNLTVDDTLLDLLNKTQKLKKICDCP